MAMCESVLASRPRFLVEFPRQSFDLTAKTRSLRSEGRIETRKLPWIRTVDSDRREEKEKKDGRNALNLERERASKNKRRKHLTLPLSLSPCPRHSASPPQKRRPTPVSENNRANRTKNR